MLAGKMTCPLENISSLYKEGFVTAWGREEQEYETCVTVSWVQKDTSGACVVTQTVYS